MFGNYERMWFQVNAFHSNGHVQVFDRSTDEGVFNSLLYHIQVFSTHPLGNFGELETADLGFLNGSIACSARPCCVSPIPMRGMLACSPPPPSCYLTFDNFSPGPQRTTLNASNELEEIKDNGVDLIGFWDGNVNDDDARGGGGAGFCKEEI